MLHFRLKVKSRGWKGKLPLKVMDKAVMAMQTQLQITPGPHIWINDCILLKPLFKSTCPLISISLQRIKLVALSSFRPHLFPSAQKHSSLALQLLCPFLSVKQLKHYLSITHTSTPSKSSTCTFKCPVKPLVCLP